MNKVCFFVAERNAVWILEEDDTGLLDRSLCLRGAVGDRNAHTHVSSNQFLTLLHGVHIGCVYITEFAHQLAGSLDRFFLRARSLV